jgi:putative hydrolases of HD superfamily
MSSEATKATDPVAGGSLKGVVNFFFEVGMLKRTPRSGFQFLGSGRESVADHTFRTALIGFALAKLEGATDPYKVACLCLFHDLPEARTGDLNYLNKRYVEVREQDAIRDLTDSVPFAEDVIHLLDEYRSKSTAEAQLAHDADQLDLLLELKEQSDLGNKHAMAWIEFASRRLETQIAMRMAKEMLSTDFNAWWLDGHDHWWEKR